MSSPTIRRVFKTVALGVVLASCGRSPGSGDSAAAARAPSSAGAEPAAAADHTGPPARWLIDGTSLAADPRLPAPLDRALRGHGRASEEVQDHIVFDLNGDGELDAVVLLPAPTVAGAYDHLVLLSAGESIRVHAVAELVGGPSFSVAVLPLVDGPTLVAVAPRLGGCARGPKWTFLRPTGDTLEQVGSVGVDDYDCAVAEAAVEFVREADGQVSAVELHHGEAVTRYRWDSSVGSFAAMEPAALD